jgi:Cu/Ag efflux protein CusF
MASKYTISTVFKGVDRMTRPVRKMGASISKMTESAEVGLRKVDAATSKVTESMFGVGKKAALGIAGLTSALVVGAGAVNQMKLESDNMTRAMGANVETVEAVTNGIKGIGLNAENVTDLYEEMNNKLGESAGIEEITKVTESLGILGLQFNEIKKLSPDEQFKAIADAALKMEDATQAAAAMDILLSGESNKIISTLRLQGKSMEDITKNYQMMNFRTDQSRKGSEDMAKAQSKTAKIIGSLTQEVSGLLGKALAPMIDKFNEWMINNKELISQNLDKLFNSIGNSIGDVGQHMETLIGWIGDLSANFSEFIKWAKWVGIFVASLTVLSVALKTITVLVTAFNLAMAANPIVLAIGAVAALAAGIAYLTYKYWDAIKPFVEFGVALAKGAALIAGTIIAVKSLSAVVVGLGAILAATPIGLVVAGFAAGAAAIITYWEPLTEFFSNLFNGIADMYSNVIGGIADGISGVGESVSGFFGFGDDDEDIKRSMSIDANTVVTPQERISRSISENKETFDINVYGQGGAKVQSDSYSSRLNLINTGN